MSAVNYWSHWKSFTFIGNFRADLKLASNFQPNCLSIGHRNVCIHLVYMSIYEFLCFALTTFCRDMRDFFHWTRRCDHSQQWGFTNLMTICLVPVAAVYTVCEANLYRYHLSLILSHLSFVLQDILFLITFLSMLLLPMVLADLFFFRVLGYAEALCNLFESENQSFSWYGSALPQRYVGAKLEAHAEVFSERLQLFSSLMVFASWVSKSHCLICASKMTCDLALSLCAKISCCFENFYAV